MASDLPPAPNMQSPDIAHARARARRTAAEADLLEAKLRQLRSGVPDDERRVSYRREVDGRAVEIEVCGYEPHTAAQLIRDMLGMLDILVATPEEEAPHG